MRTPAQRGGTRLVAAAVVALAGALAALGGVTEGVPGGDQPAPLQVTEVELRPGVRARELSLPGTLLDHVASCSNQECELWLLLRLLPEATAAASTRPPTALLRYLHGKEPGRLEWWVAPLPAEIEGVAAFDLDGDGNTEPILGEPGRILALAPKPEAGGVGVLEPLIEARGLRLRTIEPLLEPGDPWLPIPEVGALRLYRIEKRRATLECEVPLPVTVRRGVTSLRPTSPRPTALHLETPQIQRLPGSRFVVGPEAFGPQRWRSLLLEPVAEGQQLVARESFARLPSPERPEAARYLQVGEATVLLAHSLRSDKVGIFERQKVRLFPLAPDRTRAGAEPLFAELTVSRMWQGLDSELLDADRDGLVDLVLLQREGWGGGKLQIDVYRGRAPGASGLPAFEPKSSRSLLELRSAVWRYGIDLTADGYPDLLLLALEESNLYLYAGSNEFKRRAVLEPEPRWVLNLTPGSARPAASKATEHHDADELEQATLWEPPELLELDGRGPAEILLLARAREGDRMLILSLEP